MNGVVAIATSSDHILIYDINDNTKSLKKTIKYNASNLKLSDDGTILAAQSNIQDYQYSPENSLTIFSLQTGNIIQKWDYYLDGLTYLYDFDFSKKGRIVSRKEVLSNNWTKYNILINKLDSRELILSLDGGINTDSKISPDGSGVAIGVNKYQTDIYENGALVSSIKGKLVGWIDDMRLLINTYTHGGVFLKSQIYTRNGFSNRRPFNT